MLVLIPAPSFTFDFVVSLGADVPLALFSKALKLVHEHAVFPAHIDCTLLINSIGDDGNVPLTDGPQALPGRFSKSSSERETILRQRKELLMKMARR